MILDTKEYLDTVVELLAQGHRDVTVPVKGSSMVPFLHNGDVVYLNLPEGPAKRGDILLYLRPDSRYILHRVVRRRKRGLLMTGDAQQELELIDEAQVRATVTSARHLGRLLTPKSLRWLVYRHVWLWLRPIRHRLMKLR